MPHIVDLLQEEARAAISRMQASAREARHLHARAELLRHMRAAANKAQAQPLEEAVAHVSAEWMQAWAFNPSAYPLLADDMIAFTRAICRDARSLTPATEATVRKSLATLEASFVKTGTTLSDQMAFRSECAHGWWELVVPTPVHVYDSTRRARIPAPAEHAPFWSAGARPHCG